MRPLPFALTALIATASAAQEPAAAPPLPAAADGQGSAAVRTTDGLRRWAWLPAGAGAVSAWVGAWLLLEAGDRHARLAEGPDRFTPAQATAYAEEGQRLNVAGGVALGAGAAMLTGAAAMYVFGGSPDVSAAVAPRADGGAAITFQWRFQ